MFKYLWQKCLIKLKQYLSNYEFNTWILPLQVIIFDKYINIYAYNIFIFNYVRINYLKFINYYISVISFNNNFIIKLYLGDKFLINKQKKIYNINYLFSFNYLNNCKFDNFIYDECNFFVYKKLFDFSYLYKSNFNFIFLYSKSGLGKTHLLFSIINRIFYLYFSNKKVFYITCKKFINDILYCIKNNCLDNYFLFLKSLDVFLLDDINYLVNKLYFQKKILYIIEYLFLKNCHIIISSNIDLYKLNILYKLKKILMKSYLIKINNINFRVRYKYIIYICNKKKILLSNNIIRYISKFNFLNFLFLNKFLYFLYNYFKYFNLLNNINIILVKDILNYFLNIHVNESKVFKIIKIVSIYFNISLKKILSNSRIKLIVYSRQMCITLIKNFTNYSYNKISIFFKNLSISTVIYSYNIINKLYNINMLVRNDYNNLIKIISKYKNVF